MKGTGVGPSVRYFLEVGHVPPTQFRAKAIAGTPTYERRGSVRPSQPSVGKE